MIRTINAAERTISVVAPRVITLGADATTTIDGVNYKGQEIFPDLNNTSRTEIAYRYIQNVGDNDVYISIGQLGADSSNNFHCLLQSGQQKDISNHRLSVWAYSVAGSKIATELYHRNDLTNSPTIGSGNFI